MSERFNYKSDYSSKSIFEIKNNYLEYQHVDSILVYGERVSSPLISIMIPTYKRGELLKQTVKSALLQNTSVSYEIVIVDNDSDSESNTIDIVKEFDNRKVCYFRNAENIGMFGNWNRCIELAKGDWILLLHDDDTIEPNYINLMVKEIKKRKEVQAIACEINLIDKDTKITNRGNVLKRLKKFIGGLVREDFKIKKEDFYYGSRFCEVVGTLFKKEALMNMGGFDKTWYPGSDNVFLALFASQYTMMKINKQIFNYRISINESQNVDVLVGIIYLDDYIRKQYNNKYHFDEASESNRFLKCCTYLRERQLINIYYKNKSEDFMDEVKKAFDLLNEYLGYECPSDKEYKEHVSNVIRYARWAKYIRRG